jgi:anti-anti-sigma regulatory factor
MQITVQTHPTYTIIAPHTDVVNADLATLLTHKIEELSNTGSRNYIIDLQHCLSGDVAGLMALTHLHETCYSQEQSLVFTGVTENVMQTLKKEEITDVINITPTLIEAIDIISMEILERDLLNDE